MNITGFVHFLAIFLSLAAWPAAAQDAKGITAYQELVDLAPDGSAKVTLNVTLSGWDSDKIELPLNFAKAEDFEVAAGGRKVKATAGKTGDVKVIKLQFDGKPAAEEKFAVTFTAREFFDWAKAKTPRGTFRFSYTFTNATANNITGYKLKILLPPGYNIAGITSSTPRATGEEIEAPYDFATENGRVALNLRSKSVASGKFAAIAFGFEKEERHTLPVILIGLLIAALALYLKRDVLTRPDFVRESVA